MDDTNDTKRQRPKRPSSGFIKGLPGQQRWIEDGERDQELTRARASAYYWWWMFLAESPEYRRAVSGKTEEPFASMARDFGKTWNTSFDAWWLERGRTLFSEQLVVPKVRALEHGDVVNLEQINAKLVLEIPLTIRRRTILKDINRQLDLHHQGRDLRVMRHSTAQRQLNPDSRMRVPTMELLHRIWDYRKNNPDDSLYQLGESLRLSPVFICRKDEKSDVIDYKQRCMTIVVQRYLRKADALIYWAARGKFPCVDKYPGQGKPSKR